MTTEPIESYVRRICELEQMIDTQNSVIVDQCEYIQILKKDLWRRYEDPLYDDPPPAETFSN